jgi:hypothetical protein
MFPAPLQSAMGKSAEEFTPDERRSMDSLVSMVLDHFENSFHLQELGLMPDGQWESDKAQLTDMLAGSEFAVNRWKNRRETYRPAYMAAIDEVVRDIESEQ